MFEEMKKLVTKPLSALRHGEKGTVNSISGTGNTQRFLTRKGLYAGCTVVRESSEEKHEAPVTVTTGKGRLSLSHTMAIRIRVTECTA